MALLDLFDDDEPEPVARAPEPSEVPTWRLHLCCAAGCVKEGGFGYFGGAIVTSRWFCRAHVPKDFLPDTRP